MCSQWCLQQLRKEITAARSQLEKLVTEERSFKLDLFGTGGPGRPRGAGQSRKRGRPAGRKAVTRKAQPRRKGPATADNFLAKLPAKFTIDDVRKVAGKGTAISLAQWARAKKVKKVAGKYQKSVAGLRVRETVARAHVRITSIRQSELPACRKIKINLLDTNARGLNKLRAQSDGIDPGVPVVT